MSQPTHGTEALPGLENLAATPQSLPAPAGAGRPRVKPVDRSQLTWQMLDVERLIEPEHPARAIWELVATHSPTPASAVSCIIPDRLPRI